MRALMASCMASHVAVIVLVAVDKPDLSCLVPV